MFDNVVNLAQKLIQFKTISGNYEEIVQCISFLDSYAKKNNLFIQVFDNQNKPVVILSNEKTRFFDVMSLGLLKTTPLKNIRDYRDDTFCIKIYRATMGCRLSRP